MKLPTPLFLRVYTLSLHLYPRVFRQRYAEQLIDATRLQQAASAHHLRLAASLAADTLRSALREHARAATPASPGYVALFALVFTFLLLGVSIVNQQILRRGADRQPAVLAYFVRFVSPQNPSVAATLASPRQEISSAAWLNSTQPFLVLYDDSGQPIAGNATLHGALPQPPHGIFATIRNRGEFRVTWQPRTGIRVALTGDVLPSGGFVIAGQSLILSEAREFRFHTALLWIWAFSMLACFSILLLYRNRTPRPAA